MQPDNKVHTVGQVNIPEIFRRASGHELPAPKPWISPGDLKRTQIAGNLSANLAKAPMDEEYDIIQ